MPDQNPTFTVIIPVFNRSGTIRSVIESVLKQSLQDFEILVIDDGSEDGLEIEVVAIGDPRVHYVRQENRGANVARNNGIDRARGKYVAFLDSDDTFLPHHLAALQDALDGQTSTAVFARIIVDRGNGKTFLKPPRPPREKERMDEYLICGQGFVQTSTLALPTEIARRVRYLDGLKAGQDIDFAIRLASAGVHFRMLEQPGAIWSDQQDPKRISAGSKPEMRLEWLEKVRPLLSEKAYYGYFGWFAAKSFAQRGEKLRAMRMFYEAVRHRCFSAKLTARVFLQICLAGGSYRKLSDLVIRR
jgi:glycosyltransferase involved in cell wall biosynthesis